MVKASLKLDMIYLPGIGDQPKLFWAFGCSFGLAIAIEEQRRVLCQKRERASAKRKLFEFADMWRYSS